MTTLPNNGIMLGRRWRFTECRIERFYREGRGAKHDLGFVRDP